MAAKQAACRARTASASGRSSSFSSANPRSSSSIEKRGGRSLLGAVGGAIVTVGEIFLARDTFHAGTIGFGFLASASGSGIVLGSWLAARIEAAGAMRATRLGLLVCGAGFGAAALAPDLWMAVPCALVGGVGNAIFLAASTLVLQESTEDARRGHVFALLDAVGSIGTGGGMAVGAVAIAAVQPRGAWLLAACLVAVAAIATVTRERVAKRPRVEPTPS